MGQISSLGCGVLLWLPRAEFPTTSFKRTYEAFIEAGKRGVAIALLQEPYVGRTRELKGSRGVRVFQSTNPGSGTVKAAIAVFLQDAKVIQYPKLTTNNICVVGIQTGAWEIIFVT